MKRNFRTFIKTAAVLAALAQAASVTAFASYADDQPPALPDGQAPGGGMGTPPDGNGGNGGGMGTPPGGMGGGSAVTEWDAVTEYSADTQTEGMTYTSSGTDENAVHISGGTVVLSDPTVTRTSDNSTGGDNSSFYGVGAAILATDGTAVIDGGTITTDSKGGAGAFAYGDGVIYIKDAVIRTEKSTSGGIHAAGGGTLYAWDLDVETNGESSAAIRSDRGGGTMYVNGGTYTSNGTGSPAVYCTADITVENAELNATGSEGICIEGLNSLYIYDSDLSADMPVTAQNEDLTWTVIVYQSMSGDSEVGNSEFYYEGGSITTTSDILIYTTNTESHITLVDTDISSDSDDLVILRATGNANGRGWGSSGANGAQCTFTAIDQTLDGDIVYDSISDLKLYLTNESTLTGAVIDDESDAGNGGNGGASIYISSDSTWVVTDDSTCTNLYCAGTITDENGDTVTVRNASGSVLYQGSGSVTITVTGTYSGSSSEDYAGTRVSPKSVTFPTSGTSAVSGSSDSTTTDVQITATSANTAQTSAPATDNAPAAGNTAAPAHSGSDANPSTGATAGVSACVAAAGLAAAAYALRRKNK